MDRERVSYDSTIIGPGVMLYHLRQSFHVNRLYLALQSEGYISLCMISPQESLF